MEQSTKITAALISVYYKDGLEPIVRRLHADNVVIYSTGGTQAFIEALGIPVVAVESMTNYPEIFGGRVKPCTPLFSAVFCTEETCSLTLIKPRNSTFRPL